MVSPVLIIPIFIGVVFLVQKYLKNIQYVYSLPNVGFPLPLIGHIYKIAGRSPSDILPTVTELLQADPARRKISAMIGPIRHVWLFHPETVEGLLTSNEHIKKSYEYEPLLEWLGTGLLLSSGQKWHQRRKMLTPAFHFRILDDNMKTFNDCGRDLTEILINDGDQGQNQVDLFPYVTRCTLDIILESAMGRSLDTQHARDSPYVNCINEIVHLIQRRQLSPWLYPEFIFKLSSMGRRHDKCLKVLHGFTNKVITEKRAEFDSQPKEEEIISGNSQGEIHLPKGKKMAFLDLLLRVKNAEGQGLSNSDIREEVDTFMFEGHDTTACALSWTLLLLANHPKVQAKIFKEQQEVFSGLSGEHFWSADVKQEHLTKMKYLEAVVKETLRLYPSVPIFGRKIEHPFTVDGVSIPTGTTAVVMTTQLHRNEAVWNKPNQFIPERFLQGSAEEESRHPFAYIPFSAGPRNCIGQKFALMEEKTVLSRLLRRVTLTPVDAVEDIKPVIEVITRPDGAIFAKFVPREY